MRHLAMIISLLIIVILPGSLEKDLTDHYNKNGFLDPTMTFEKALVFLYISSFAFLGIILSIIYANMLWLIPKLLFKNKYFLYLFSCIFLCSLNYFFDYWLIRTFITFLPPSYFNAELTFVNYINSVLVSCIFLIATAGYKVFKKWVVESKQLAELKEANLKEELKNLKNQINPHFLFNTLNNLNVLVKKDVDKASNVILGLSDVLRFYLYEANKDKILLRKDVDMLKELLSLEKIRRDDFQFAINFSDSLNGILVPPFIFVTFVENAIKHSVNNSSFSFIDITFCKQGDKILFVCKNSKPKIISKNNIGGIGLQNVTRRLELLYKDTFDLTLKDEPEHYEVNLLLPV